VEVFHIWYIAGQLVASGLLACVNYFVYKHYIFPSADDASRQSSLF
jgi:hypothetical protein